MDRAREQPSRSGARDGTSRATFPSRRAIAWYLAVLLIAAFSLRTWWASGWPNPSRVFDERYSFENVHSVLLTGSLKPVRNFYPSPVYYLPPALAIRAARPFVDDPAAQLFSPDSDRFGPTAYHLARGFQVLYGTASVLLLYLLGAMMFGRKVALLAATTAAFVPWLVQVSGVFKPDAQVVFFILVVLIAGVRWMRSPSALGALAVGCAVALATSSKLIAGVTGAAFGLGALVRARGVRQYGQIALAGISAIGLFLLLNPHIGIVLAGIDDIKWDYARRARWAGMTKAEIPLRTLDYLLDPMVFGPLLGALALIGYASFWVSGLRAVRSRPGEVAGPRLMLAVFPLAYVGLHAAQSAWFRANNFTHILPPFVLGFAWVAVVLLHTAVRRFRVPRPIMAVGILGLGAVVVSPGILFVYESYTKSTLDAASRFFEKAQPRLHGRVVIVEPVEARGAPWRRTRPLTEKGVALVRAVTAAELPEARRKQSDAEILRGKVPVGAASATVETRKVFRPKFGRLRGPMVTVLQHPWSLHSVRGPLPIRWGSDAVLEVELPVIDRRRFVSIAISLRVSPDLAPDDSPTVLYGDLRVPLHRIDLRFRKFRLLSERFRSGGPGQHEARITGLPQLALSSLRAHVYVWSPPEESASASD